MKLLSPVAVAAALGIKPQSLRLRRMKGQGPPFIRLSDSPTGRAYYRESEFNAWLAARPSRMGTGEEKQAALSCASAPPHGSSATARKPRPLASANQGSYPLTEKAAAETQGGPMK